MPGSGSADQYGGGVPEPGLIESLRHHLHAGETHYPVRSGMAELRERIGARLTESGLPDRGAEGVLITASEGEALFVTLLGLAVFPGGSLTGAQKSRYSALLDWLDISVEPESEVSEGGLCYHDPRSQVTIRIIGDALFKNEEPSGDLSVDDAGPRNPSLGDPDDVLIGTLDAVDGMAPFTLGFVAAALETVTKITKWKQASSICAPGPSQRAALWALGVRP
jgi:hypothetical protein